MDRFQAAQLRELDRVMGSAIREIRQLKGMSLEQLSSGVGIKAWLLESYESGRNRISLEHLNAICDALEYCVGDYYAYILQHHYAGWD